MPESPATFGSLAMGAGMSPIILEAALETQRQLMGDNYQGYDYTIEARYAGLYEQRKSQVFAAGDWCVSKLGDSHGAQFIDCALAPVSYTHLTLPTTPYV